LKVFLLLSITFLINQFVYSQEYSDKDIIGTWEVNKCELYINGELIKTAYINNYGDFDKVIEGKSAGTYDQRVTTIIKRVLGSSITFNEDSTVSWDATISELNINSGYWVLENTGDLFISENKNNLKLHSIIKGRIMLINEELRIILFESGLEGRLSLIKK